MADVPAGAERDERPWLDAELPVTEESEVVETVRASMWCLLVGTASAVVAACSGGDADGPVTSPSGQATTVSSTSLVTSPTTVSTSAPPTAASTSAPATEPPLALIVSYEAPIDLGVLPGTGSSTASDINNDGLIVGEAYVPAGDELNSVAVWWPTPTGGPQRLDQDLGFSQIAGSRALRVNDRGQILVTGTIASADEGQFVPGVFVVDPVSGSSIEVIVAFAGEPLVLFEAGLNNDGDVVGGAVVGVVQEPEGQHTVSHAFRWELAIGEAIDLGTLPWAESSHALDINERGQVVGESGGRPFVWDPDLGEMRELATAFGPFAYATATSINDNGQISGEIDHIPVVWRPSAAGGWEVAEVAACGGGDINDAGQIVGRAAGNPGVPTNGCVGDANRVTAIEVPESIAGLSAINDDGLVVGMSDARAALWIPVLA